MLKLGFYAGLILLLCFSAISPAYADKKVEINYPNLPTIYNLTLAVANTEYSYSLPATTSQIEIQCRTAYNMKLAFVVTESGTTYRTIKADTTYFENDLNATTRVIYLQSTQAGVVAEILVWSD